MKLIIILKMLLVVTHGTKKSNQQHQVYEKNFTEYLQNDMMRGMLQ
jgi:hypothetical protein